MRAFDFKIYYTTQIGSLRVMPKSHSPKVINHTPGLYLKLSCQYSDPKFLTVREVPNHIVHTHGLGRDRNTVCKIYFLRVIM